MGVAEDVLVDESSSSLLLESSSLLERVDDDLPPATLSRSTAAEGEEPMRLAPPFLVTPSNTSRPLPRSSTDASLPDCHNVRALLLKSGFLSSGTGV